MSRPKKSIWINNQEIIISFVKEEGEVEYWIGNIRLNGEPELIEIILEVNNREAPSSHQLGYLTEIDNNWERVGDGLYNIMAGVFE